MLCDDIKALRGASRRDLRKFGLTVGAVFCALAAWWYLRHKHFYWYALVPGLPLIVLGTMAPRGLKWVYVAWMTLAMLLGAIVSTVLLTMLFYLVVTPVGMIARLAGKDFLARRIEPSASSYWIVRDAAKPKGKRAHEKQF